MKAQVIIYDKFLKERYGIYRYSIVDIVDTHKRKRDGYIWNYRVQYKGGDLLYMKPHELKILT